VADLDMNRLEDVRTKMPIQLHRWVITLLGYPNPNLTLPISVMFVKIPLHAHTLLQGKRPFCIF